MIGDVRIREKSRACGNRVGGAAGGREDTVPMFDLI